MKRTNCRTHSLDHKIINGGRNYGQPEKNRVKPVSFIRGGDDILPVHLVGFVSKNFESLRPYWTAWKKLVFFKTFYVTGVFIWSFLWQVNAFSIQYFENKDIFMNHYNPISKCYNLRIIILSCETTSENI